MLSLLTVGRLAFMLPVAPPLLHASSRAITIMSERKPGVVEPAELSTARWRLTQASSEDELKNASRAFHRQWIQWRLRISRKNFEQKLQLFFMGAMWHRQKITKRLSMAV